MKNAKVSIVIPVYNGHDFLSEAIDSALAQTYNNIEVIVVNDGSDDGGRTESMALSYGDKLRYFKKSNGGVASALNYAIEKMSGEYFSWLSHDDLYVKDKIEKELDVLSKDSRNNLVIYSDYSVFTADPEDSVPVHLKSVPAEHFRYWITVENRLHGCTLLVPRKAFEKVGGFNESLKTTQDYDLWFRMAKIFKFIHIPEKLVNARSHADQGSHKMVGIALEECNALLSDFISDLLPQEIVLATDKSLGESYAEIASSMFERGFYEAGKLADQLAGENGMTENSGLATVTRRSIRHQGSRFINMSKRILPFKIKHLIKSSIRPLVNRVAGNNIEEQVPLREKFSEIYKNNIFGGRISRSGEGSDLVQTKVIRRELPRIIDKYSIRTFLDAPCGDWFWMKETDLSLEQYIGVDIVEDMIEKNRENYGSNSRRFLRMDLATESLPRADLIFSRDCLVHLNFEDALKIVRNFKQSGAKYLLTTTFRDRKNNNDLVGVDNFWRPLNMCLAPFNFPQPILFVNEGCTEEVGQYTDKGMGLWLLSDINL